MKIANTSFVNVAQYSKTVTNISIQNLSFSLLLSKNISIIICETVILPVVLYGCETRYLTLREENGFRVSENRVLRIFGPKRDVMGGWRKLHNGEPRDLYSLPSIIMKSRRVIWAGHVAWMGICGRNVYRTLVGKPEGKRSSL
jgi:hypothetical protein